VIVKQLITDCLDIEGRKHSTIKIFMYPVDVLILEICCIFQHIIVLTFNTQLDQLMLSSVVAMCDATWP